MIIVRRNSKGPNPLSVPALNTNVKYGDEVKVENHDVAMALFDQGLFEIVKPVTMAIKKPELSKDEPK